MSAVMGLPDRQHVSHCIADRLRALSQASLANRNELLEKFLAMQQQQQQQTETTIEPVGACKALRCLDPLPRWLV